MREPRWRRYLRFWRPDSASDVDDELRFHFAQRVAEFETNGASHDEAVAEARRRFGDVASVRTELVHIDERIGRNRDASNWRDAIMQDFRYSARSLRRQPVFVAAVVVTLALAVGANLTVFSLVDALFFRPPGGVVDAGSLRRLYVEQPNLAGIVVGKPISPRFSYDEYRSIREATRGIARVATDLASDSVDVTIGNSATVAGISYATADLFPMLGVRLERGRSFSESDDDVNTPANVAVISHDFAKRIFGDRAEPLGAELRVRDRVYKVIGVSASGFNGVELGATSIWVPFSTSALPDPTDPRPWYSRRAVFIPLIVRLLPGVDGNAVAARATIGYQRANNMAASGYINSRILIGPIQDGRGPGNRTREESIAPRIAVVALLLFVIACANVANLLLARSWTRRREFAVRAALGISRSRLATLVLAEALLLAAFAGLGSLLVGHWGGQLLRSQLFPRIQWPDAVLSVRAMVFVAIVTLFATLLAGAAPALVVSRRTSSDALRSGNLQSGTRRSRLRSTLIVVQAALAVVLVVGATLFGKSLRNVRGVDLGFDADRLVVASVYFPDRVPHPEAGPRLMEIAERARGTAGVAGATVTYGGPLDSWMGSQLFLASADSAHPITHTPNFIGVGADYFRITGTKILEGRAFLPSDRRGSEPVIIVGSGMAKQLWPHEPAIGQCLRPTRPSNPCYRIVGVAEDAHQFRIVNAEPETEYYFPLDQLPNKNASPRTVLLRAGAQSADDVATTIRSMLRDAFPNAQVRARSATRALEPEMRPWILGARVFAALSALALLVAMIGVYAMAAFEARQRTREIGVRIALGAQSADVVSLLVRQGSRVVAIGVVLGSIAAIAAGRFVESILFGVSSRDPISILGASTILLAVAAMASFIPSWRATRIDPVVVLREE
jgi:predicted permease